MAICCHLMEQYLLVCLSLSHGQTEYLQYINESIFKPCFRPTRWNWIIFHGTPDVFSYGRVSIQKVTASKMKVKKCCSRNQSIVGIEMTALLTHADWTQNKRSEGKQLRQYIKSLTSRWDILAFPPRIHNETLKQFFCLFLLFFLSQLEF